MFVQMGALAQSFPFGLDLKVLDGATVAAQGTYDEKTHNKVEDVHAAVQIKLALRGELKPEA